MTVYLAFNEAEGLDDPSGIIANTSRASISGVCRAGFESENLAKNTSKSFTSTFDTGISEGWVRVGIYVNEDNTAARKLAGDIFRVYDSDSNEIVGIYANNDGTGTIRANSVLDGTLQTLGTKYRTLFYLDINIKLDASGFVKIYLDGVLAYEETGDTIQSTSGTTFNQLWFNQNAGNTVVISTDEKNTFVQVLVSDQPTFNAKVYTLDPSAGSTNDWDSGSVTDIDETGVDDTDQVITANASDQFTIDTSVTLSDPSAPARFTAVVQSWRASYDSTSAPSQLTPFLNDTTATSTSFGTGQTLGTGLEPYQYVWNDDPADSTNWSATKINNYEFGLRTDT